MAAVLVRGPVAVAVALVPVMAVAGAAQQVGVWAPPAAFGALAIGAVLAWLVARQVPVPAIPAWAVVAVVLIAVAAGGWAALTHGEHVAVRRDAGAYATYALSLARFGGVPIDPGIDVLGVAATDPFVRVGGAANYQVPVVEGGQVVDLEIVPQFLVGTPAVLTLGWWVAGWQGLFVVPAVVGAAALAGFGALAAVTAGPRTAVGATAALALAQPVLLANRQTYSEPLSLLFLVTAGTVLTLAVAAGRTGTAARLGLLAGALFGANMFVRVDGLREAVLLIPVVTVLVLLRHPAARGLVLGLVALAVPAALAATPWSSPYVAQVRDSLFPLLAGAGVLAAAAAAVVALGRRVPPRRVAPLLALLPGAAAAAVAVTGLGLVSRPLWLVDYHDPLLPGLGDFVGSLQMAQGLPVDPMRSYAEHTVTWLSWWLGPAAVAAAFCAAVMLAWAGARAVTTGGMPPWLPVLVVGLASTVLTLARPGITPDHPWADRRLVTTALPTVALLAAVAFAWLVGEAARLRGAKVRATAVAATAVVATTALLVPPALATWPVATDRTEVGQPAAADAVCAELPEDAVLIAVDDPTRVLWGPVLRARCGVGVVGIAAQSDAGDHRQRVREAAETARENGYAPVALAGATPGPRDDLAAALDAQWSPVVQLDTTEPQRWLEQRPDGTRPLSLQVWLAPL
ncbi:MAG: hypothetical protein ACFCVF_02775 [Kineosporiaceae bacterium]